VYAFHEDRSVESICYEQDHINKVLEVIKETFSKYFEDFLVYGDSAIPSSSDIQGVADALGIDAVVKKKSKDKAQCFKNILIQGLTDYESDRQNYLDILDEDALEEYLDDPPYFKSKILKDECPIIRYTIYNRSAKALDKYRRDFSISDANELLSVVTNLYNFAVNYIENEYDPRNYDEIDEYKGLVFSDLDSDSCTVYGVIGGGIKSHILYKFNPSVFPNRSRMAIWSLWYLSNKKVFDCECDSEFLMIDVKESITQQNYFYPYELFAYYAHQIYQLLKAEADDLGVYLNPDYRYVIVDSFLSFVANSHISEIDELTKQLKENDHGHS